MRDIQPPRGVSRWLGWLLIAVGGLIVLSCGACTLGFIREMALDHIPQTDAYEFDRMAATDPGWSSLFALAIGGAPTALGGIMMLAGWRRLRRKSARRSRPRP